MREAFRQGGFTTVEVAISLVLLGILTAAMMTIAAETFGFLRDSDADVTVETEGTRAFARLGAVLRKTGRMDDGGTTYPRVTAGGSELEFRVLADADGNGYAFDDVSGELEWDPTIFTAKVDGNGNLDVHDPSGVVYRLGRHIQNLQFETIAENSSLHLKEVRVTFEARKDTGHGYDKVFSVSGSFHMRN